jgi:hypothetical protein
MARRSQITSRENPGFETMIIKTKSLIVGIGLLAGATFGGQTIESFTKQSLGLDLGTVPFGMTAQTNFGKADAPASPPLIGTNLVWMTNSLSGMYRHEHPNRLLKYGFLDARLASIRITINSFEGIDTVKAFGTNNEIFEQRRKELRQILDAIKKIRSSPQSENKDASFRVQYRAMCSPSPESLFQMEIEIAPNKILQTDGLFKTVIDTNSGQYVVVSPDQQLLIAKDKFNRVIWSTNVVKYLKSFEFAEEKNEMEERIRSVEMLNGEIYVRVGKAVAVINKRTGEVKFLEAN